MTEWVMVNGARVERRFFDENLAEARSFRWEPVQLLVEGDHHHCLICGVVLGAELAHRSIGGYACRGCFSTYAAPMS